MVNSEVSYYYLRAHYMDMTYSGTYLEFHFKHGTMSTFHNIIIHRKANELMAGMQQEREIIQNKCQLMQRKIRLMPQ